MRVDGQAKDHLNNDGEIDFKAIYDKTLSLMGVGNNSSGVTITGDIISFESSSNAIGEIAVRGTAGADIIDLVNTKTTNNPSGGLHVEVFGKSGADTFIFGSDVGVNNGSVHMSGGSGNDIFVQETENMRSQAGTRIDGGLGHDTVVFKGPFGKGTSQVPVRVHDGSISIYGINISSSVEEIRFSDKTFTYQQLRDLVS